MTPPAPATRRSWPCTPNCPPSIHRKVAPPKQTTGRGHTHRASRWLCRPESDPPGQSMPYPLRVQRGVACSLSPDPGDRVSLSGECSYLPAGNDVLDWSTPLFLVSFLNSTTYTALPSRSVTSVGPLPWSRTGGNLVPPTETSDGRAGRRLARRFVSRSTTFVQPLSWPARLSGLREALERIEPQGLQDFSSDRK